MKAKKSNLTFVDIPLKDQKADDRNTPFVSAVAKVFWKGKPLFIILHDSEPPNEYTSPECRPWFIRTAQEDHLRVFHGYADSLASAKAICETEARKFESFLTEWHNTPKGKQNVEVPSSSKGEAQKAQA